MKCRPDTSYPGTRTITHTRSSEPAAFPSRFAFKRPDQTDFVDPGQPWDVSDPFFLLSGENRRPEARTPTLGLPKSPALALPGFSQLPPRSLNKERAEVKAQTRPALP